MAIILVSCCASLRGQSSNKVRPACPARPSSENLDGGELLIIFDSVEFPAQSEVSPQLQKRLVDAVNELHLSLSSATDPDASWLDEVKESTRLASQDLGYFKVLADATAGLVRAEPHRLHYWISVDAKLGPKYVLGEMTFSNSSEFPGAALRKEFDLQRGDIFNASKIRDGLDRIRRLYAKHGYIDMTAEPEFKIHDDDNRIDLNFSIEEGGQYRIKSVEVRALDNSTADPLLSKKLAGQIFDPAVLDDFLKEHPELHPSDSVRISRDTLDHSVSLLIDPQLCGNADLHPRMQ